MKVLASVVVALAVAGVGQAATVVLKGGKQLEAASYVQQGNYVVVRYADGRAESYPLSAVDIPATRAANAVPDAAPPPAKPTGPHSPFANAVAPAGETAARVTDEDVQHVARPEEGEGAPEEEGKVSDGQVVLLGYDKQLVGENQWAVTATIANTGSTSVRNVTANVRLLDEKGNALGTGTASFPGTLEGGKQGMISTSLTASGEPRQIAFEFQWQTIKPAPAPEGTPAAGAKEVAPPAPQPAEETADWTVPPGSSPNAMPENPMAVPPLTAPPAVPQAPRGGGDS